MFKVPGAKFGALGVTFMAPGVKYGGGDPRVTFRAPGAKFGTLGVRLKAPGAIYKGLGSGGHVWGSGSHVSCFGSQVWSSGI